MQTDRLANFDFAAHNAEVKRCWEAFNAGKPYRTPIIAGMNMRFFMFNPQANPDGLEFQKYSEDPDTMFDAQLRFLRWSRFNVLQDAELGLPEKWIVSVNFQNYYEAAWFGCQVHYIDGQVPDTMPDFADNPERVMEHGIPSPFGGALGRAWSYHQRFCERARQETFCGRPIEVAPPGCLLGTDGLMTVACGLFGPDFVCEAMAGDPDRLERLLTFVRDATIERIRVWRERFELPALQDNYGYVDDSIALISTSMYRDQILPHHKRLIRALATDTPRAIHLCGDATRHFPMIRDELNVRTFDTGFPVDFAAMRQQLGDQVRIWGGPHVEFLRSARPPQVRAEVRRIMSSGIVNGGLFVLREGNNLAPGTPLENVEAMYDAGREYGKF